MANELTAAQRVALARHPERPGTAEFIEHLFTDFFEQRGDRLCAEDGSILGGIALFHGKPVTVIGHRKGRSLEQNLAFHFGMPSPEGYRKAQRLMLQAEKFHRPIITFIDTPGAYPGLEAEARGQGDAIAHTLALSSSLTVPVISVVTGEGGSGGALALGVGNRVLMLENAVYSVLSPEGFAAILWKDSSRSEEACEVMKLTAADLLELEVVDKVIPEPAGGAHTDPETLYKTLDTVLARELNSLSKLSGAALAAGRYKKFRAMGAKALRKARPCADSNSSAPAPPCRARWSPTTILPKSWTPTTSGSPPAPAFAPAATAPKGRAIPPSAWPPPGRPWAAPA